MIKQTLGAAQDDEGTQEEIRFSHRDASELHFHVLRKKVGQDAAETCVPCRRLLGCYRYQYILLAPGEMISYWQVSSSCSLMRIPRRSLS